MTICFLIATGTLPFWYFTQVAIPHYSEQRRSDARQPAGDGNVWSRITSTYLNFGKAVSEDVHQPWYADDAGASGHF